MQKNNNNFYEELLDSDWLGRSKSDYTYEKKGSSTGWEHSLKSGEAFSRYICPVDSNNLSPERQLMLTKQSCYNLMDRMITNGKYPKIDFTEKFDSWRKDDNIMVTVEPLNPKIKFPSFNHRLDPVLGFFTHEMAHYLYTEPDLKQLNSKQGKMDNELRLAVINIVEDERIEMNISNNFRGYANYIGKAKDYAYGKKLAEAIGDMKSPPTSDLEELFQSFLYLLRYPKALEEGIVNKHEEPLKEIMGILKDYPRDKDEVLESSEKVMDVFRRYFQSDNNSGGQGEDEDQQEQEQNNSQSQTDDSDSSQSSKPSKGGKKGDKDSGGSGNSDGVGNEEKEDSEPEKGGNSGNGKGQPKESNSKIDKNMGQQLKELLEVVAEATEMSICKSSKELAELITGSKVPNYSVEPAVNKIESYTKESIVSTGSYGHTYPTTANLRTSELSVMFLDADRLSVSGANQYDKALREVSGYASSLRAKIQQLNRSHNLVNRGLTEGDFDEEQLVPAIIGAKAVYKNETKIMNQGACVVLLIDESGSMGDGGKWYQAQKIAVMFERALEGVNNVDFYCYGHTTGEGIGGRSDSTVIKVYYEGRRVSDRQKLGKIYAHETNRDGHAIVETIGRVRSKIPRDMPIVMFMISDGEPSASVPQGYNGKSYTKKCVDTVEKFSNSQVIHIAIESGIPSRDMFNSFVEFSDPSKLVQDIGVLLRNVISKRQMPVEL